MMSTGMREGFVSFTRCLEFETHANSIIMLIINIPVPYKGSAYMDENSDIYRVCTQ